MITRENMTTLISASEAKTTADTAFEEHNEMAVAAAINGQANLGEYDCLYQSYMSDALITKLKGKGYTVAKLPNSAGLQYLISWKSA